MSTSEELLQTALEAGRAASAALMEHFGRQGLESVTWKPDGSPVTAADLEAEGLITEIIAKRYPDHAIVAEETREDPPGEYTWIIDPIDGTQSFARGIPFFSVQIAVLKRGVPIVGVSSLPALGSMLYGAVGLGAFLNDREVRVSTQDDLSRAAISLGGLKYFVRSGYLSVAVDLATAASHARIIGDAYPYHLLASGRLDAVIEAHVRIWDIAAHAAIVAAAGGNSSDFDGNAIGYRSTSLVSSNGVLNRTVLDRIRRSEATTEGSQDTGP